MKTTIHYLGPGWAVQSKGETLGTIVSKGAFYVAKDNKGKWLGNRPTLPQAQQLFSNANTQNP